jgi:hypothetical protein
VNRCARYEVFVPPEPLGLEVVRQGEGGPVFQRGVDGKWRGIGYLGSYDWKHLLWTFGPVYPVVWSDGVGAEGEQSGAPDAGQPDHSVG